MFISVRFVEAYGQASMLKVALENEGISCFLCAVQEGDSIAKLLQKILSPQNLS